MRQAGTCALAANSMPRMIARTSSARRITAAAAADCRGQVARAISGACRSRNRRVTPRVASRLLDRDPFRRPRLAYRDVASATNKLTLIAAMLPGGTVSTHTVFVLKTHVDERSQWCLLGLLNSFVANYLVRLQVMTHVTATLMARLPVPRPATAPLNSRRWLICRKRWRETASARLQSLRPCQCNRGAVVWTHRRSVPVCRRHLSVDRSTRPRARSSSLHHLTGPRSTA